MSSFQGVFWANNCASLLAVPCSTSALQCSSSSQTTYSKLAHTSRRIFEAWKRAARTRIYFASCALRKTIHMVVLKRGPQ